MLVKSRRARHQAYPANPNFQIVTACSARPATASAMQFVPPKILSVSRIFGRLVRMRQVRAWLMILLCTDAVALVDLLTGPDLWLGPVYLLVICLATWSLGWPAGQATGLACMGISLAINGFSLYPYDETEFALNFLMRVGAVSAVIAAIAGARCAFVREWWLARSDTLTGALNRQAFFELAPSVISSERWRLLVYADLDGLKKVNDLQGHSAGDAYLRAFGATAKKLIRRDDVFARMGGDEFVLFMSVKDEASASTLAARLHKAINNVRTEYGLLKCSVGGLIVAPGFASIDDLVLNADSLMYQAKLRGACLQLDTYTDVESLERDDAKVFSRGARAIPRKGCADDRDRDAVATTGLATPR